MIRLLLILLASAGAVALAMFFAERPGAVTLVWQGWQVETSLAVLLLGMALGLVVIWLVLRLVIGVITAPARLLASRRRKRQLLGYRVLTDGLVAIAAGDAPEARRHSQRAQRYFEQSRQELPPLARLLTAQAALLAGDETLAQQEFTAMLDSPETEFLGLRGLIVQALKAGDDERARILTARAQRLRPSTNWVLQSQLALETRAADWRAAEATLREAVRRGAVTAPMGRHHKATLLIARSQSAISEQRLRDALKLAAEAQALEPNFPPAAIHYAKLLRDEDRVPKAQKLLETAWANTGHPALAIAYDGLIAADSPALRLKRIERLVDLRQNDPESHLAAADVALSARLWGEARRHLDRAGAAGSGPWSKRLCQLMAQLADSEGGDVTLTRKWLERAAQAPEAPSWVCGACTAETAHWSPVCPSCHGFDTLAWQIPDRSAARRVEPAQRLSPILDVSFSGQGSAKSSATGVT